MDQADLSCKQTLTYGALSCAQPVGLLVCCLITVNGLHKAEPPSTMAWLLHVDMCHTPPRYILLV